MGCSLSKKSEAANDVVSVCGDRKRLAKALVARRKAFAEAHCKYIATLSAVSSAIGVFVARLSVSDSRPFTEIGRLPTIQDKKLVETHQGLVQTCSDSWSIGSVSSSEEEEEEEEEGSGGVCEYFYGDDQHPLMSSNGGETGWDFFNLLDNPPLPLPPPPPPPPMAVFRKKEGVKKRESGKMGSEVKEVKVSGNGGKELVVALKDLEVEFGRAYEAGLVVSRMLEVDKPHLQPLMEEIKENSRKFYQPNVWSRSPSSQSSSCKSLISSTSNCSSTWADSRIDLFDGTGGMESGSHSFTLGRLYAWEKKLYDEVKAAEQTMKSYQQKCSQLKRQPGVEKDNFSPTKEAAEVSYLYNRILVARRSVESISKRIEKLRDEELQPQLVELLHGLMRTWKIMSESHETQNKLISEVKSFNSPTDGKLYNDSHRIATLQLEKELRNWQSSFLDYLSTQKTYVLCLCGWLSKLVVPEPEAYRFKGRSASLPPSLINGPTLLIACRNWLAALEKLPEKEVKFSMKSLAKDVHDLYVQQGEEYEAKKKVDGLVKEMDRKALVLKSDESRRLLLMPGVQKFRGKTRNSAEDFSGRKNMMDLLSMRLESEKVKHQNSIDRTQAATLDGLKVGFSSVFESLTDFSRASVKLYADLVTLCQSSDVVH